MQAQACKELVEIVATQNWFGVQVKDLTTHTSKNLFLCSLWGE